jgi:hypothetical protein
MLPYPVDYHPYTAYHISETLQILLFTGLGFFLLLKKLVPEPKISLDLDWTYRMGGRAFLWLARKPIQAADTFVGELYRVAGLVPLMFTSRLASLVDNEVVDGLVDGVAGGVRGIGRRLRLTQRGQMQENLTFAFAVAAALIVAFLLFVKAPAASVLPKLPVTPVILPSNSERGGEGSSPHVSNVAQTFLSAVSPTFLSAPAEVVHAPCRVATPGRLENLRYSRQECLRYTL